MSGQQYDDYRYDDRYEDEVRYDRRYRYRSGYGAELSSDERTWGMLAHLSTLLGFFAGATVLSFVGPLVVMLTKGKEYRFVDHHAKEALNFQITMLIAALCCIPLVFLFVGIFLLIALLILDLVLTVIAGIKANEGREYRYPFSIRFVQ